MTPHTKNPHAVSLGKLGGRKPGSPGKPLDPAKARAMVASRWAKYRAQVAKLRLEYLRGEIRAERISYGEINELMSLAQYIQQDDVELLQWAVEERS